MGWGEGEKMGTLGRKRSFCQGRKRGWSLPGVTPPPMALSQPHLFPSPVAGAG